MFIAVTVVAGCSTERTPEDFFGPSEANTLVVDAVLLVGRPLGEVRLSLTSNPDAPFQTPGRPVRGAEVFVESRGQHYRYIEPQGSSGLYQSVAGVTHLVEAQTRYELTVIAGEHEAHGVTITPPPFRVEQWVLLDENDLSVRRVLKTYRDVTEADSLWAQPENQLEYTDGLLEARFARPEVVSFQIGIFSLDDDSPLVIDPDFLSDEDLAQLERVGGSPPLEALDGTLRLPWFAIFFEGAYQIKAYALDENWYDLVRSTPELGGGPGFGGTAGDNFERPLFSIEGGIGVFGSASLDSMQFYVHPRP